MTGQQPQVGELWDLHGAVAAPPGSHTELRFRVLETRPNGAGGVYIVDAEWIELSMCPGPPSPRGITPAAGSELP